MIARKRKRRPKLTHKQVAEYFKFNGSRLLTKEYLGTKQTLTYRCKCGKEATTCFNNYSRGHRCQHNHIAQELRKKSQLQQQRIREAHFCLAEVARQVGMEYNELHNWVFKENKLPKPTRSISRGKLYYNRRDIQSIRKKVKILRQKKEPVPPRNLSRKSYYTIADLARLLDVPYGALYHFVVRGKLPKPSHRFVGMRAFYSDKDVQKIKKMVVVE